MIDPQSRSLEWIEQASALIPNIADTALVEKAIRALSLLESLRFSGTLRVDTRLSGAPKLTVESLLSVINSLADLNQEAVPVTKKITFGARNKAKLSAAQLAQVTDKGWVLG